MLPPATPSALPADKIVRLGIGCPADSQTQSLDGRPVAVHFGTPVVSGGKPPVVSQCSPPSGSPFDIGSTRVMCGASDALQQAASCAFQVTILGPPRIAVTRFVAFGDSITAGVVSPPTGGVRIEPTSAYPYRLQRELQSRYVTQTIDVINEGNPGEHAREATSRFRSVIGSRRPEVVMLMEGTNDLDPIAGSGVEPASRAIDSMVRYAQDIGVDVLLMTVPPSLRTSVAEGGAALNAAIRKIAVRRGAVLIDVHDVLLHGACSGGSTIPCIGDDGLHPTAEGLRLVAREIEEVIVDRFDIEILPEGASQASAWSPPGAGAGAFDAPVAER